MVLIKYLYSYVFSGNLQNYRKVIIVYLYIFIIIFITEEINFPFVHLVPEKVDVGFIVGHHPDGFSHFKKILSVIHSIVERFDQIGRDATLPGVVTYGGTVDVSIPLGAIVSRSELSKIANIKLPAKGDNIKAALRRVANDFFYPGSSSGARSDAAKSIYLFIDGNRASKLDIKDELQALKRNGVNIITIAYGKNQDLNDDVRDVTSLSDQWFFPEDLDALLNGDGDDAGDGAGLLRPLANSALPGVYY